MNLHIPLSPEAEAKLRQQAMAAGKDVDTFVLEAIEHSLATSPALSSDEPRTPLGRTLQQLRQQFITGGGQLLTPEQIESEVKVRRGHSLAED